MKRSWDEQELYEHWTLTSEECVSLTNWHIRNQLGYAVLLKFFQLEGRFPYDHRDVPDRALRRLRREYPDTPYVFVSERGGPLTDSTVRKVVA